MAEKSFEYEPGGATCQTVTELLCYLARQRWQPHEEELWPVDILEEFSCWEENEAFWRLVQRWELGGCRLLDPIWDSQIVPLAQRFVDGLPGIEAVKKSYEELMEEEYRDKEDGHG
jgi:hypothetical protein